MWDFNLPFQGVKNFLPFSAQGAATGLNLAGLSARLGLQ
jgi:hypothetical protein